jgi:formylglycine-generating enzyme required for sulfatase activity
MGVQPKDIPSLQKIFNINNPQLFQDEIPRHTVTLRDFSIDKFLVTNAQFKAFTAENPQWPPGHLSAAVDNGNYLSHWKSSDALTSLANHPVVNVNWYAAVAYCRWAGKRLPTEAEGGFAARGGAVGLFPWGDAPSDETRANYSASGLQTTTPVGAYPPNGLGVYDMAGNVWQFLADEWQPYSSDAQQNPIAGGNLFLTASDFLRVRTRRVIRGGSFGGNPVNLWVEYRDSHPPANAREFIGFRCAKYLTAAKLCLA